MQALTNWIGHAYSDGYPKQNLYPGQDLSSRLAAAISIALESPTNWDPYKPENDDEEPRILNAIRSTVGDWIGGAARCDRAPFYVRRPLP